MNIVNIVNRDKMKGAVLEEALAAKLREILGSVSWLKGWKVESAGKEGDKGFDFIATIPKPGGGKAELYVECKSEMRPSLFRMTAEKRLPESQRSRNFVPVLAMPSVSARVSELCEEHGWGWYDLAGNYSIDVPGVLHLAHTGNEPVHKRPRPKANLSTAEAGRVIRALLDPENAGVKWTQRRVQDQCVPQVSLGLVNKVVRHLINEAYLEEKPEGGFALRDPMKLLFAWRDAYRFDLHERRNYFTLLHAKKLAEQLARLTPLTGGFAAYAAFAAFSAADIQAPHVRQSKTWLYIRQRDISRFEELAEAKPVDSGENLVVLIPFDDGVFYPGEPVIAGEHRLHPTNLVQTYVDLYHCGERGEEAAEALLKQRLEPEWRRRGLL